MPAADYKKVKEIGSGSFACAYLVQQKDASYKVLKEVDMSRMGQLERSSAEDEVKVLSKLKHPYIVRYWESFVATDSRLCIIMDYCEGGDLWNYIERHRHQHTKIPEVRVMRWFTQMCLAIKYLHDEQHVLHRDIKPQNIFLVKKEGDRLGSIKIADFGISKVLKDENAFASTMCGTPFYLSPEMYARQPYGCPSDMWATGCVLYQLCALKVPFEAHDINLLMLKISRGPLPTAPTGYSREIDKLISELLDRSTSRRPTAAAILQRSHVQHEIQAMLAEKSIRKGSKESCCSEQNPQRDELRKGSKELLHKGSKEELPRKGSKEERHYVQPCPLQAGHQCPNQREKAAPERQRSPLRELNTRARSPSPHVNKQYVKPHQPHQPHQGLGAPGPHRCIANEVLRPSRARAESPRAQQAGGHRSPSCGPSRGPSPVRFS